MGDDPKPDDAVTPQKIARVLRQLDAGEPVGFVVGTTTIYPSKSKAINAVLREWLQWALKGQKK